MTDFNTVTAEFFLPCGHALRTTWRNKLRRSSEDEMRDPNTYYQQLTSATEQLMNWLESRAEKHQCHLVTEDNPNGLPRSN